jgi:STIP1 family protein 1
LPPRINAYFSDFYSKAIAKNNADPAFFNNRALCYMRQKKWNLAEDDCRRALELDPRNVKVVIYLFNFGNPISV